VRVEKTKTWKGWGSRLIRRFGLCAHLQGSKNKEDKALTDSQAAETFHTPTNDMGRRTHRLKQIRDAGQDDPPPLDVIPYLSLRRGKETIPGQ